jgi:hypothetical protein
MKDKPMDINNRQNKPISDVLINPKVKVLKVKKNVPTVVEIDNRRYVLDHKDHKG